MVSRWRCSLATHNAKWLGGWRTQGLVCYSFIYTSHHSVPQGVTLTGVELDKYVLSSTHGFFLNDGLEVYRFFLNIPDTFPTPPPELHPYHAQIIINDVTFALGELLA